MQAIDRRLSLQMARIEMDCPQHGAVSKEVEPRDSGHLNRILAGFRADWCHFSCLILRSTPLDVSSQKLIGILLSLVIPAVPVPIAACLRKQVSEFESAADIQHS